MFLLNRLCLNMLLQWRAPETNWRIQVHIPAPFEPTVVCLNVLFQQNVPSEQTVLCMCVCVMQRVCTVKQIQTLWMHRYIKWMSEYPVCRVDVMEQADHSGDPAPSPQSSLLHRHWQSNVCVWRLGATGHGWRQSRHTWEGVEVYQYVGLAQSWWEDR